MSEVSVNKSLLAFLNGLSKRLYFGEENITDEFLRDEVLQVSEEGTLKLKICLVGTPTITSLKRI